MKIISKIKTNGLKQFYAIAQRLRENKSLFKAF